MTRKQTNEETRVIHTPAGMHRPPEHGDAADGADIASTDMSVDPGGSRADPSPTSGDARPADERGAGGVRADVAGRLLDVLGELERLATSDPGTSAEALRDGLGTAERKLREALAAAGVERSGGASRASAIGSATTS